MENTVSMKKKDRFWIVFIIIVAAVVLLRLFVFEFVNISGESMYPTLHDGNLILINKVDYTPVRGDIVILDTQLELVKRVIGLPGEKIQIQDGEVYINGQKLEDKYQYPTQVKDSMPELTIPDGSVFVMGDNRDHSADSRVIGPIKLQSIRGRMLLSLW
jgi:signal peptidase I, bacterial type